MSDDPPETADPSANSAEDHTGADADLRTDIRRLGHQLGNSLVRQHGETLLETVEKVRRLARDLRKEGGREGSTAELTRLLADADADQAIQLVRAFTMYFHLANVAEQVHRIEDLNIGGTRADSHFDETVRRLVDSGIPPADIAALVNRVDFQPVFTAHPTEASRRSILNKLARISDLVEERTELWRTSADQRRIDRRIDELIEAMWQTDEIRHDRPDPFDEARFVLYYVNQAVRDAVPQLLDDMAAVLEDIGERLDPDRSPIRFGTWVGGDRDGNPNVSPGTTLAVLDLQRRRAIELLIEEVGDLWALERSGAFRGLYHVLGGTLSALDGVGPDDLHVSGLLHRAQHEAVCEVILALGTTVDGQTPAHYLAHPPVGARNNLRATGAAQTKSLATRARRSAATSASSCRTRRRAAPRRRS